MKGRRRDGLSRYRRDHRPLAQSTHATVWRAFDKVTGDTVALKSVRGQSPDGVARMRREIEVGQRLGLAENVLPVIESAPDDTWFTMPLALGDAEALWPSLGPEVELRRILAALSRALGAAHHLGYVHRDIKPHNVLLLPDGRWVLADWGLVRRPRGETSQPGRTESGAAYGTLGFAAPELGEHAHHATPAADVYSIGQLIGWATTGRMPLANVPLVPDKEPWRSIVQLATSLPPDDRPQSMEAFDALVSARLAPLADQDRRAQELLRFAAIGDNTAGPVLLGLAASTGGRELLVDILPRLSATGIRTAAAADPAAAAAVVARFGELSAMPPALTRGTAAAVAVFLLEIAAGSHRGSAGDLTARANAALVTWAPAVDDAVIAARIASQLRTAPVALAPDNATAGHRGSDRTPRSSRRPAGQPRMGRYATSAAVVIAFGAFLTPARSGLALRSGERPVATPSTTSARRTPTAHLSSPPKRSPRPSLTPSPLRTPAVSATTAVSVGPPRTTSAPTSAPARVAATRTTAPVATHTKALPKPCWKYDPDYFKDPDRQDYVAAIGTPHTQSFYQLDWYPTPVKIVRVNSDCSQTTVFVSNAGDERTFPSFVGQQWVLVNAEDYYVGSELSARKGDVMWYDTAGRRNYSSMNGVPDGYDAQPIPPCC